jgi:Protein of unknown function (DUF3551)
VAGIRFETLKWNSNGTGETSNDDEEIRMRRVILALLTVGGFAALGTPPAQAVGTRYPFCLTGPEQPGLSYCTYTSYEQCQATASGRQLWCIANPYYDGGGSRADAPPPSAYRPLPGRALPPRD